MQDTNHDGQPDNLEDSEIHLDLSVKLADISPSIAGGGLETVERVTITVDAKCGYFLDGNGQPVNTLIVSDMAALMDLVFVPSALQRSGAARHPGRCRRYRAGRRSAGD